MSNNPIPALNWIISFLEGNNIPYVVCGGLAAQAYGADRQLADIDLYVPDEHLNSIAEFGTPYITYGPAHHVGDQWDLTYVKFNYQGQDVEIGSDKECKILDHQTTQWVTKDIRFDDYERHELYGVECKVMTKAQLISYKQLLNREVDIEDIKAMEA